MFVIYQPDDSTQVPTVEYGYLAGVNQDGTYKWVRNPQEAIRYVMRTYAQHVLDGDARLTPRDSSGAPTTLGARIEELKL